MGAPNAIELLEDLISDIESKLNLAPGEEPTQCVSKARNQDTKEKKEKKKASKAPPKAAAPTEDLPEICKLEFKVGLITKVWVHPDADKLYCEEIDVGEEGGPRQIASGLRPHYSEEEMLGKRVLVVANLKVSAILRTDKYIMNILRLNLHIWFHKTYVPLKAKNLVGFKSHGMVLCAAEIQDDGTEKVEFVEPPEGSKQKVYLCFV